MVSITDKGTAGTKGFSQDITLTQGKKYVLDYWWAYGANQIGSGPNNYCYVTSYFDGQKIDEVKISRGTAYKYTEQSAIFESTSSAKKTLTISVTCYSGCDKTGDFLFDDVTVREYCPPAVPQVPCPPGVKCGIRGHVSSSCTDFLGNGDSTSLEDCAVSCKNKSTCKAFAFYKSTSDCNESAYCKLYGKSVTSLGVTTWSSDKLVFYDKSCFIYKPTTPPPA